MSVENDSVVYVDFELLTEGTNNYNGQVEYYGSTKNSTIVTIEEYERRKIINELVECADNLVW